jgi:hypothetical protein
MPFDKYEEIMMPKTESIKELWPALLTKALLKLFHHKLKRENYLYEEIGDIQIIYALTGYHAEKIFLQNPNTSNYYGLYSFWSNMKRKNAAKEIKTYRNNSKNLTYEKQKSMSLNKEKIKQLKIEENDYYKDENTYKKIITILRNILTKENYLEKRKFLLNFNTLNLYNKWDNKFDNIDDYNDSFYNQNSKKKTFNDLSKDVSNDNLNIFNKEMMKTNKNSIKLQESKNNSPNKDKNRFSRANDMSI